MVKKLILGFMLSIAVCPINAISKTYNIVFDMGDVLVATNKLNVFVAMGPLNILKYVLFDKQNPRFLQKRIFDVLDFLGKQKECRGLMAVYKGRPLPQIMCDWLTGAKDYSTIMHDIYDCLDDLYAQDFFAGEREVEIIISGIEAMFNPTIFAHNVYIKNKGLKLAQKLAKKGHALYILSNWDAASFELLATMPHMQSLFSLFEPQNIIISGRAKSMKPHNTIFDYFIQHTGIKPEETYFIDDLVENCIAGDRAGLTSLQLVDGDYKSIKKYLANHGVL